MPIARPTDHEISASVGPTSRPRSSRCLASAKLVSVPWGRRRVAVEFPEPLARCPHLDRPRWRAVFYFEVHGSGPGILLTPRFSARRTTCGQKQTQVLARGHRVVVWDVRGPRDEHCARASPMRMGADVAVADMAALLDPRWINQSNRQRVVARRLPLIEVPEHTPRAHGRP